MSGQHCENYDINWETVHCYQNIDLFCMWSEHAAEGGLMLSLEAREFFKIFVLFCYITSHLMTGPWEEWILFSQETWRFEGNKIHSSLLDQSLSVNYRVLYFWLPLNLLCAQQVLHCHLILCSSMGVHCMMLDNIVKSCYLPCQRGVQIFIIFVSHCPHRFLSLGLPRCLLSQFQRQLCHRCKHQVQCASESVIIININIISDNINGDETYTFA